MAGPGEGLERITTQEEGGGKKLKRKRMVGREDLFLGELMEGQSGKVQHGIGGTNRFLL